jgi:hypothetical protein
MKTAIETLESRIAPANIFFNPSSGTFTDEKGKAEKSDLAASASTGATFALLLQKGDSLIMDSTVTKTGKGKKEQQVVDANSVQLASVSNGSSLLFFTDLNSDGHVGEGEITGLAASDKLKGEVKADIKGSVATALLIKGKKATFQGGNLLDASIDELKVTGKVTGHLLAGGSITGANIGGTAGDLSVQSIATGDAAAGITISFNGGAKSFSTTAPAVKSGSGGSIQTVTLAHGTQSIEAGAGVAGGSGGSVTGITIGAQSGDLAISAGAGSSQVKGSGGAGGAVSAVEIGGLIGDLDIAAGDGGDGGEMIRGGNNAGAGGAVTNIVVTSVITGAISITGGVGGYGGYSYRGDNYFGGAGGNGGKVDTVTISIADDIDTLEIAGGIGGDAQVDKNGGSGGSVSTVKVTGLGTIGVATITGGDAGVAGDSGGAGGNGGDVATVELPALEASIIAGEASSSGGAFAGGKGGSVTGLTLSRVSGSVEVAAGSAGDAGYSYNEKTEIYTGAVGGAGGSIQNVTITGTDSGESEDGFVFAAGAGGEGTVDKNGGAAGEVSNVSINLQGFLAALSINTGDGGAATDDLGSGGTAGAGGSIKTISVAADAILGLAEVIAGAGGSGAVADGAGGSLFKIDIDAGDGGWGILEPVFIAGLGGTGSSLGADGTINGNVRTNYAAPLVEDELIPVSAA